MKLFKQWRINRLRIEVAKIREQVRIVAIITAQPQQTSYYIDKHIASSGCLAELEERIRQLELP